MGWGPRFVSVHLFLYTLRIHILQLRTRSCRKHRMGYEVCVTALSAEGLDHQCAKSRILHKKGVRVATGRAGKYNLKIAPVFYNYKVDI